MYYTIHVVKNQRGTLRGKSRVAYNGKEKFYEPDN